MTKLLRVLSKWLNRLLKRKEKSYKKRIFPVTLYNKRKKPDKRIELPSRTAPEPAKTSSFTKLIKEPEPVDELNKEIEIISPKPVSIENITDRNSGPAIRIKKGKLDIWVGLDFGTSSTKIAYRRIGDKVQVHPVIFQHNLKCYPQYCLPSSASYDKDGNLLLGIEAGKVLENQSLNDGIRRLKVLLAGSVKQQFQDKNITYSTKELKESSCNNLSNEDIQIITSLYIAYAMTHAHNQIRQIFTKENDELDLRFNMCVPIDYAENNPVKSIFEKTLGIGHRIYKDWIEDDQWINNPITERQIDDFRELVKSWKPIDDDRYKRAYLREELVAEIASYLYSQWKHDGIHAIIDFGAGTTDIAIFEVNNVSTTGRIITDFYQAEVFPRGTHRIEWRICEYLKAHNRNYNEIRLTEFISSLNWQSKELENIIRDELNKLWTNTKRVWREAYSHNKGQSKWSGDNVTVFVSGGGSNLPFVSNIFSQSWMDNWGPYSVETLPTPDHYITENLDNSFKRMSVAYGLTISEPEAGKFTLPKDAPVVERAKPELRKHSHNQEWLG